MNFREGNVPGPDYKCSKCGLAGVRLWRQTHTFLSHIELLCAECAEKDQVEQIARYEKWHTPNSSGIGDLVPARPTPEGDTFWGHTSGDVEFWYGLRQYLDEQKETDLLRRERDYFCMKEQAALKDWLDLLHKQREAKNFY